MASSTSDSTAVLSVCKAFLAAIKSKDIETMRAQVYPGAQATLIRKGKPALLSMDEILSRIAIPSEVVSDEQSFDETVHVDGDFATAWTPYKFYEDEKLHHTGTNSFTLWKSPEKGRWFIVAVADVAREEPGIEHMGIVGGQD